MADWKSSAPPSSAEMPAPLPSTEMPATPSPQQESQPPGDSALMVALKGLGLFIVLPIGLMILVKWLLGF
jgi:hypothetical protein